MSTFDPAPDGHLAVTSTSDTSTAADAIDLEGYRVATVAGGRTVEYLVEGDPDGFPLVFHHGTPGAAVPYAYLSDVARERGLALVVASRPGYGTSDAYPGRRVADIATDVAGVLDDLGCDDFITLGWSGGGPHALACAAAFPQRCRAAAVGAGVAPFHATGLEFFDGMGAENIVEYKAAIAGRGELDPLLEEEAAKFRAVSAESVAESLGDLASPPDRAYATGDFASRLLASINRGVARGIEGWVEDDLAFTREWGIELRDISVPVSIWHGTADWTVPFAHGQWLAAHVAGAVAHLYDDEGHLSLWSQVAVIFDDLIRQAGL
ncbi:Pimeloyl-ACP methyl ester carboxylesterase [Nocardioides terrae]|uniref:Pimeloyl-ACP methyl ester carboxylesterase n=1 Tax=Nocardioides terrae TaxID=574651 RepID=A0A1I1NA71_9ACTN|nr:alpha/beta hydrolase [Nocardioides terrae]SFC94132.1 Pimeloyl-ACP methyl ester carboxylesterase [Nocardioides terrae]